MSLHRYRLARERAGLTLGQASRLLGWNTVNLSTIELSTHRASVDIEAKLAKLYQVRIEWLTGEVELRDYTVVDGMNGADEISFHDRDVVAEFAASLPRTGDRWCVCSCGARFLTLDALNEHAAVSGGLLHGDP